MVPTTPTKTLQLYDLPCAVLERLGDLLDMNSRWVGGSTGWLVGEGARKQTGRVTTDRPLCAAVPP